MASTVTSSPQLAYDEAIDDESDCCFKNITKDWGETAQCIAGIFCDVLTIGCLLAATVGLSLTGVYLIGTGTPFLGILMVIAASTIPLSFIQS